MEKMIDLRDLLKHELTDLYSAEEQIIEALPLMIEKANNGNLKIALQEHLKVTEKQKARLEEIQKFMGEAEVAEVNQETDATAEAGAEVETETNSGSNKQGFFSRLFGGGGGEQKCKGMEGLITEGSKLMKEDMNPEVLDAAIIASAQKIEHYEICGYGTARAYAKELNLEEVANRLGETLNEEYFADDLLTELAVGKLNIEAEFAADSNNKARNLRIGRQATSKSNGTAPSKTNSNVKAPSKASSNGKSKPEKSSSKGSATKSNTGAAKKAEVKKSKSAPNKTSSPSKSPAKKSSPSKSNNARSAFKAGSSNAKSKVTLPKKGSNSRSSNNKIAVKSKSSPAKKSASNNGKKSSATKGGRRY